jgi:hypothetical protein
LPDKPATIREVASQVSEDADNVASTERSAEFSNAGLVAGALVVKALKVVGADAALVALKKFGVLLLLPLWTLAQRRGTFPTKPSRGLKTRQACSTAADYPR